MDVCQALTCKGSFCMGTLVGLYPDQMLSSRESRLNIEKLGKDIEKL